LGIKPARRDAREIGLVKWVLATSATLFFCTSAATAEPLLGETLAHSCAGCHGTFGDPAVSYIPALAGLSVEEFTRAMNAYRDGTRLATMMTRIAPAFSDSEIQAMADYFAALPRPVGAPEPNRNLSGN